MSTEISIFRRRDRGVGGKSFKTSKFRGLPRVMGCLKTDAHSFRLYFCLRSGFEAPTNVALSGAASSFSMR